MLTDEKIKRAASNQAVYKRGVHYYRDGFVHDLTFDAKKLNFTAQVEGSDDYLIKASFDDTGRVTYYSCECQAFENYDGACKHIIAVLKAIQRRWHHYFMPPREVPVLTPATRNFLRFFRQMPEEESVFIPDQTVVSLAPTVAATLTSYSSLLWLEFSIGSDRMYVVKDIPQLLLALEQKKELIYGKNFTLRPQEMQFDSHSDKLLTLLRELYAEEQQRISWNPYAANSALSDPRRFRMTTATLSRFFAVMEDRPFTLLLNQQTLSNVQVSEGRPSWELSVHKTKTDLCIAAADTQDLPCPLTSDCHYVYHRQVVYKTDAEFRNYIQPLFKAFAEQKKPEILIPTNANSEFFSTILPALEKVSAVRVSEDIYQDFYRQPLEPHIFLDSYQTGLQARLEFHYGEAVAAATAGAPQPLMFDNKQVLRNTTAEARLIRAFQRYGFTWQDDKLVQADEEAIYEFLQHTLPELQEQAEIFYASSLKQLPIQSPGKISARIRLAPETNLLEFSLGYDDMSPKDLLELLAAHTLKKKYHRLRDGSFITLDSPEFQSAAALIKELGLSSGDIEKQTVTLPKHRAFYIDSTIRAAGNMALERNSAFKQLVQDVLEPQDTEYPLPAGIQGKLRDYQRTGFRWLKSLAAYGLGGILADDMGLGKTLQVLTFLLSEKTAVARPSLVIAPTSLVYNWQEEAAKFTPELRVLVIDGQQDERQAKIRSLEQIDLAITTYGLLRRDIDFYTDISFAYCILDEGQHIKNPGTLNAKSVKKITARNYFALTGTPIENDLTELWSLFDFILPEYLGNHKYFSTHFETPIVKSNDPLALGKLSRHIQPFILRRMKKNVLKELPPKIESKLPVEMTTAQAKLYKAWILKAQAEMESEISSQGFDKSRIKILALLTRLRQICCHPSLFLEDYQGGSGKLDMLLELVQDAAGSGHRILVFSQFTAMLDLIRQELQKKHLTYYYLDGATPAEERLKLVRSFNSGETQLFLISLKAGGTGLNLTGADIVIHFDPWWNPAVEDQATDRAYRLGQKQSVQVYKMITKGTLEEKIYLLQQKKKELIDALIVPGESFLNKMSEQEIRNLFTL